MKKTFAFIILALLLSVNSIRAEEKATADNDTPVTIKVPKHYRFVQAARFPLDLPGYILRAVTWPIGVGSRYLVESGTMDRVIKFISNEEKTLWLYPIIEGGAGSGFGGGLGVKHTNLFHEGYRTGASYRTHINEDQLTKGYFGQPKAFELWGRPISYELDAQWLRYTGQDFYGIGNDSSEANHSKYLENATDIEAELAYHFIDPLKLALIVGTNIASTRNSTRDGYPSVSSTFAANELASFDGWITYFTAELGLAYDTRDNKFLPESGGLYTGYLTRFQNVGSSSFDFIRYNLDLRHSFRLWRPRSALTLRTGWVFNQGTGGGQIPFWQLATLDASNLLRGFSRGRFTDNDSAVFNAEYRFPIWDQFDGVMFFDTGRVFHSPSDFSFGGFKYSIGGGLRVRLLGLMLFRFDAAYGGEGMNYMFGVTKSL